jgi:hypothetical protein
MRIRNRWIFAPAALVAGSLAIGLGAASSGAHSVGAASSATDLAGVCPSTIVVQTDWNPEADHGHLYEMLGPNPTIDADKKAVTGDLYADGKPTGVKLQIRAGGPAIGYSTVSAEMYEDKSITLGYVDTDEAIEYSGKLPTTAVFAENNISPQIIMWSPQVYPDVKTIKQLGVAVAKNGGVIRYFAGAAYMSYLTGSGILSPKVVEGDYNGTPSAFVTDRGKSGQQGFATAEPYIYSHEVQAWDKPVRYQLIADTGWSPYPEAMSVRTGQLKALTPCLKKLVPIMQQADVDYLNNPTATNNLIDKLVAKYNNGWTYDAKVGAYCVATEKKLGIASDAGNSYIGALSSARIEKLIKLAVPIFDKVKGALVKPGLKPSDLYTDQFLSHSIGLK